MAKHLRLIHRYSAPSRMKPSIIHIIAALAFPAFCQAQMATDDIKVGTLLSAAGIVLHGIGARVVPLPPGNWTVVHRLDDKILLRGGTDAEQVTLTLVNELANQNTLAAVLAYTPDVTKVRWPNGPCDTGKGFFETAGTTTGSLDYVCIHANYFSNFKPFLKTSNSSKNAWIQTNVAPLIPYLDRLPASQAWLSVTANRDLGRSYTLTLFARAPVAVKTGDQFEQALHSWALTSGKAAIASINGEFTPIPNTPSVEVP